MQGGTSVQHQIQWEEHWWGLWNFPQRSIHHNSSRLSPAKSYNFTVNWIPIRNRQGRTDQSSKPDYTKERPCFLMTHSPVTLPARVLMMSCMGVWGTTCLSCATGISEEDLPRPMQNKVVDGNDPTGICDGTARVMVRAGCGPGVTSAIRNMEYQVQCCFWSSEHRHVNSRYNLAGIYGPTANKICGAVNFPFVMKDLWFGRWCEFLEMSPPGTTQSKIRTTFYTRS